MVTAAPKGEGAAAHVTMLQRTPTYIMAMPRIDTVALALTRERRRCPGRRRPWRMAMSYQEDAKALRGPVFDEHLRFEGGRRGTLASQGSQGLQERTAADVSDGAQRGGDTFVSLPLGHHYLLP